MMYHFRKGKHRPTFSFPLLHTGTDKTITVTFSKECWYQDPDWERDWNKLYGWSYGFLPRKLDGKWRPAHHYNSDRLVWRPSLTPGFIEVRRYAYEDGKNAYSENVAIFQVPVETPTRFSIPSKPEWGYTLSPFHGGAYPAPNNYTITLS